MTSFFIYIIFWLSCSVFSNNLLFTHIDFYSSPQEMEVILLSFSEIALYKNFIVPAVMFIIGGGIIALWTKDICSGKFSGKQNFFQWREGENLLWPHIIAEYLTSIGLITGSIGLYFEKDWSLLLSLLSLGAVTYSAINSSGWVLAERKRIFYGIPIWVSLIGAIISIIILIF